jgi:hypothetical protein
MLRYKDNIKNNVKEIGTMIWTEFRCFETEPVVGI